MKMLGKSSLSSKLKMVVDAVWYLSLVISALVVVIVPIALLHPFDGGKVRIGISDIGFKMEPDAAPLHSANGVTAYFSVVSLRLCSSA
jgi:hypothetical protein